MTVEKYRIKMIYRYVYVIDAYTGSCILKNVVKNIINTILMELLGIIDIIGKIVFFGCNRLLKRFKMIDNL